MRFGGFFNQGYGWQQGGFGPAPAGCRQIDSMQAHELIRDGNALVVDVREPHEFAAGRIPEAQLIPLGQIAHHVDTLKQHGERPIILSCRTGSRSEMVCRFLHEQGFENIYNLAGGVMGWQMANLPLDQ